MDESADQEEVGLKIIYFTVHQLGLRSLPDTQGFF
jgi:hypothetical protein